MKIYHFDNHSLFLWMKENKRYWLGFYTLKNWNMKCWDFWRKDSYFSLHTPYFYFYISPINQGTTHES